MRNLTTLGLLCLAIACARAPEGPVQLMLMQPSDAAGLAYSAEMLQSIVFESPSGVLNAEREYQIRFQFDDAQARGGDSVSVSARLDSVRAIMVSPHGRQVVDTRILHGKTFAFTYARIGGAPTYPSAPPAADFGMFGGAFPVSIMVDFLFPPMPDQPVQVGDAWERVHVRRQVDGGATPTEGSITSRYTFAGFEKRAGAWLARLEVAGSGALVGADAHSETATDGAGTLEATGFILLGVADGIVREVSLQESVTAPATMGGSPGTRRQTTSFHITAVASGG